MAVRGGERRPETVRPLSAHSCVVFPKCHVRRSIWHYCTLYFTCKRLGHSVASRGGLKTRGINRVVPHPVLHTTTHSTLSLASHNTRTELIILWASLLGLEALLMSRAWMIMQPRRIPYAEHGLPQRDAYSSSSTPRKVLGSIPG